MKFKTKMRHLERKPMSISILTTIYILPKENDEMNFFVIKNIMLRLLGLITILGALLHFIVWRNDR